MKQIYTAILMVITSLFFTFSAQAASNYYSSIISVDVTDVNAAAAQDKAMATAQRSAFLDVVKKISTAEVAAELSGLEQEQILNFIKSVSVISEKRSDVRYVADLQININEALLKEYMSNKGLDFIEVEPTRVLVVPIFREFKTDSPLLWEAANVWRSAWEDVGPQKGLIKIFSIPASGDNYLALNANAALTLNQQAMQNIAKINNVSNIYIADAVYNGIEGLHINLSSFQNGNAAFETIDVAGIRGEELFKNSIEKVREHIADKVKKQNLIESRQKMQISVLYTFLSMKDWVNIQKQLKEIGYIKDINVDAITYNKAQFKIDFVGTFEKLAQALGTKNLSLTKYNNIYILESN